MRIAILTANLGGFDLPIEPSWQKNVDNHAIVYHCFTDEDFPPVTGLTPRLQYRIPKLFGWEMYPDFDIYIWLDGSMSLQHEDSIQWFLDKLGDADIALFKHPWRNTIEEEVNHIEDYLQKGKPYITSRYRNGLHKEQLALLKKDPVYLDDVLYTSTAFIYRNNDAVQNMMEIWWYYQSRYFTCDQVALPYAVYLSEVRVNKIEENQFKTPYISLASHHK